MDNTKSSGWRIVPKESWKTVVAEYADRIAAIRKLDPWNVTVPDKRADDLSLKQCIFSPSDDPQMIFVLRRLCLFALNSGFVAFQASQTVVNLWEHGQFIVVPLNTRFILECWSRVHFAKKLAEKVLSGGDLDVAEEKIQRLTFGTRSEAHLPWGGTHSEIKSIHINDCLRSLTDVNSSIMDSYNFLSESSHPSFTENGYFQMAGPPISNWDNKAYEAIMRPMLERCFSLLEQAVFGIVNETAYFIVLSQLLEEISSIKTNENES
jgi:hypothetical protein